MKCELPQRPVFTSRRMEQQWNRIQGVKMVRNGIPVAEVARFFSVPTRAAFGWVATFAQSAQNGLLAKDGAGRPPKVNAEQLRWIAMLVRDNTPNQLRFDFGLWTLRLIGQLIEREFKISLSLPTLGKSWRSWVLQRNGHCIVPMSRMPAWCSTGWPNACRPCVSAPKHSAHNCSLPTRPACAVTTMPARRGHLKDVHPSCERPANVTP